MVPLSWWQSVLVVLAILILVRVAFRYVRRALGPSLDLVQPRFRNIYHCKNGHYFGSEKPPPYTLCPTCIELGLIKGKLNGVDVDPRILLADRDRGRLQYFVNRQTVSADEFWELEAPKHVELPLSPTAPLPETKQELERQIQQVIDDMDRRTSQIDAVIPCREQDFKATWAPGMGALAVLAFVSLFLFPLVFESPNNLAEFAEQLIAIALSTWQFLRVILIIFFAILFVRLVQLYRRGEGGIRLREFLVAFLFSEILAVLFFPLLVGVSMTFLDVLRGLVFGFLAEATVFLFDCASQPNKLADLRASCKASLQRAEDILCVSNELEKLFNFLNDNRDKIPAHQPVRREQNLLQRFMDWIY